MKNVIRAHLTKDGTGLEGKVLVDGADGEVLVGAEVRVVGPMTDEREGALMSAMVHLLQLCADPGAE